jgi:hypothetical protein
VLSKRQVLCRVKKESYYIIIFTDIEYQIRFKRTNLLICKEEIINKCNNYCIHYIKSSNRFDLALVVFKRERNKSIFWEPERTNTFFLSFLRPVSIVDFTSKKHSDENG